MLKDKRAGEYADKLRSAVTSMLEYKKALEGRGYQVVIEGGKVTVTRQVEEAL